MSSQSIGRLPSGDWYLRWRAMPPYSADWREAVDARTRTMVDDWVESRRTLQGLGVLQECVQRLAGFWFDHRIIARPILPRVNEPDRLLLDVAFDAASFADTPQTRDRLPDEAARAECSDMLHTIVQEQRSVQLDHIAEIHRLIFVPAESNALDGRGDASFEHASRGAFRPYPAFVLGNDRVFKEGCPPQMIQAELRSALDHIAASSVTPSETLAVAAWTAIALSMIHPFLDGNGRVSRMLASLVLVRAGLLPMIVPAEERGKYLWAVSRIHHGECAPIVSCMCDWQSRAIKAALQFARV